jgi:hypothetical protein
MSESDGIRSYCLQPFHTSVCATRASDTKLTSAQAEKLLTVDLNFDTYAVQRPKGG